MPFCYAPWTNIDISPQGNIMPCCKYVSDWDSEQFNIQTQSLDQYRGSAFLTQIKQQFTQDQWPAGCVRCQTEEQNNIKSKRQLDWDRWQEHYAQYQIGNDHWLTASIAFGNTCNLKCITCYLIVLAIEYVPVILKNRKLRYVPSFLCFEFELHKLMYVLAGVGAFLSFFHQGSLGGLYGVMQAKPFAYREGFFIWPSTFFLFIASAMAAGPSFLIVTTTLVEKITGKRLVEQSVLSLLGKISGTILVVYVFLKSLDTMIWINHTSPSAGVEAYRYYQWQPFGSWILFTEIVLLGLVPALILLNKSKRENMRWLVSAASLVCIGVTLNRFVLTIQTLALPSLPFDPFLSYLPSWQETGAFVAVIAYGVLVYSFSYRYLPLFPRERELEASHVTH